MLVHRHSSALGGQKRTGFPASGVAGSCKPVLGPKLGFPERTVLLLTTESSLQSLDRFKIMSSSCWLSLNQDYNVQL